MLSALSFGLMSVSEKASATLTVPFLTNPVRLKEFRRRNSGEAALIS